MLNQRIQDAFNKQINAELYSSYLYLSMSAYFASQNLKGMAHWMRMQVQEENLHAMKFIDFVNERGGRVVVMGSNLEREQLAAAVAGLGYAAKVLDEAEPRAGDSSEK